jgi:putative transposase
MRPRTPSVGQELASCPRTFPLVLHRRLPRWDLRQHTYFLTPCLRERRHLFHNGALAEHLISLYAAQQEAREIALHGYVVMPDHYHVLFTLTAEAGVSDIVRAVHSLFAAPCRAQTDLRGTAWQTRFHDHVIRSEEEWRETLSYIHENPVTRGLVARASDYPWSSAGFWETGEGPVRCAGPWW